jgi:energy-coupling factor transport system substrate-specific component
MHKSRGQNLLYLLATIAVASIAVFGASALRNWRGGSDAASASNAAWTMWLIGLAVVAALYVLAQTRGAWEVGTREVVYMAIGAALYGVLSWLTNALALPSISLVSLRPAVAIPLFFGWAFGPAVGFFAGAMGNILGDFLTGWGVFPTWDLGNGLMGLIAGLASVLPPGSRPGQVADTETARHTLPVKRRVGLPMASVLPAAAASCVAVLLGMGFAAASSIYVNGYSPQQAFVGEFLPAASTNLLMAVIFVPMLLRAWEGVRGQRGR